MQAVEHRPPVAGVRARAGVMAGVRRGRRVRAAIAGRAGAPATSAGVPTSPGAATVRIPADPVRSGAGDPPAATTVADVPVTVGTARSARSVAVARPETVVRIAVDRVRAVRGRRQTGPTVGTARSARTGAVARPETAELTDAGSARGRRGLRPLGPTVVTSVPRAAGTIVRRVAVRGGTTGVPTTGSAPAAVVTNGNEPAVRATTGDIRVIAVTRAAADRARATVPKARAAAAGIEAAPAPPPAGAPARPARAARHVPVVRVAPHARRRAPSGARGSSSRRSTRTSPWGSWVVRSAAGCVV